MTISDIKLVYPDDTNYKSWARRNHFAFDPPRTSCPFARDYERALRKWEGVVQSILRQYLDECPKRILCWKEANNQGRSVLRYRELDYVHGPEGSPKLFVEIKQRETLHSGSTGSKQMAAALNVAHNEWSFVAGACLNVHMASILELDTHDQPQLTSLEELPRIVLREPNLNTDVPVLWIDSKVVATFAVQADLLTEEEIRKLPRLRKLAQNPLLNIGDRADSKTKPHLADIWPD